ncbi:IS66 family insertion sequence element accessory protein TnpB [Xanthobacter sp. 91]|uniref:IS66 family insertion sequence element accessory protein TnpB n=1 Tax=Xanthobacter sp. 91 TaxID=1117244 RepID=UPI0009DE29B0|nr:IS66 family insertion sequence element accessory protein TnpB [Xanthobacter sp. 91]
MTISELTLKSSAEDPFSGTVYVFRAKRADRVKLVFWDGTGVSGPRGRRSMAIALA